MWASPSHCHVGSINACLSLFMEYLSLPSSLNLSLPPSFSPSLPPSFSPSLPSSSLLHYLPLSLSLPHSLPRSLPHSLPCSLSPLLFSDIQVIRSLEHHSGAARMLPGSSGWIGAEKSSLESNQTLEQFHKKGENNQKQKRS